MPSVIHVGRFQMISSSRIRGVEKCLDKHLTELKAKTQINDLYGEFRLVDSIFTPAIYELSVTWHPKLNLMSYEHIEMVLNDIVVAFDNILLFGKSDEAQFKTTLEILSMAGELAFEQIDFPKS